MSAWIVSEKHIDMLVTAGIVEGIVDETEADQVGADLWSENHKSVNYRYGEDTPTPAYSFTPCPTEDLFCVIVQIHCYDYQTCEHADYDQSSAYRFVRQLEDKLLAELGLTPERVHSDRRWADCPWGV